SYTIRLIASNPNINAICNDTVYAKVHIQVPFTAGFNFSDTTCSNTIAFMDTSTIIEGVATSWRWNFGDGITSEEENPIHTFSTEGIYQVKLTGTSGGLCSDSIERSLVVAPLLSSKITTRTCEHQLSATGVNGKTPYTYLWNTAETSST